MLVLQNDYGMYQGYKVEDNSANDNSNGYSELIVNVSSG